MSRCFFFLIGVLITSSSVSAQPMPLTLNGRPYQPHAEYSTLDAGRDALKRAEKRRRYETDRQIQVRKNVMNYQAWYNWYWGTAYPLYGGVPWYQGYLGEYGRWPSCSMPCRIPGCWMAPWPSPLSPDAVYGYNYLPYATQPVGHEKVWTSPNSYIYKPKYASENDKRTQNLSPSRTVRPRSSEIDRLVPQLPYVQ